MFEWYPCRNRCRQGEEAGAGPMKGLPPIRVLGRIRNRWRGQGRVPARDPTPHERQRPQAGPEARARARVPAPEGQEGSLARPNRMCSQTALPGLRVTDTSPGHWPGTKG